MRAVPFLLAVLLGVAAAALVACGSSGSDRSALIPKRSASRLSSALTDVRQAVADGDCDAAQRAISRARSTVGNLPRAVNDRLVARLRQGISNLETIAPRECARQETQTETVPTTTTTTPKQTTPTETTTTKRRTTPTATTPTATTTTPTSTTPTGTTTTPPAATTTTPADTSGGATTP